MNKFKNKKCVLCRNVYTKKYTSKLTMEYCKFDPIIDLDKKFQGKWRMIKGLDYVSNCPGFQKKNVE